MNDKNRRVFVGLIRDHKTRIGRIMAKGVRIHGDKSKGKSCKR